MTKMLRCDTPLSELEKDRLNRKDFSKNLAQSIIELNSSQSFAYALYGPWGSGKSTILNFVEHYIKDYNEKNKDPDQNIVIFRFNPWMFSSSEKLTQIFLEQLCIRLGMEDVSKNWRRISELLGGMVVLSYFVPIPFLPQALSKVQEAAHSKSEAPKKDMHHIKEDLIKELNKQNGKILIIIDDLDRLHDDEIKDFMKMIKAVCDFPKIIYLIACDDEKINNVLNSNTENNHYNNSYLEKIIQCSYSVPPINRKILDELFREYLREIVGPLENDNLLDKEGFEDIYRNSVLPHLNTVRNVKKLINLIAAHYTTIIRNKVNISDFIAIQILHLFYKKAYDLIANNKKFLVISETPYPLEERKKFYDELHKLVPENNLENFKNLMKELFPRYLSAYQNLNSRRKLLERGVSNQEYFDIYFNSSVM